MASIKISALTPLELDRLTDRDVFIVNDQDATTQKITFKTIKEGLDRDARYFTGPVEFSNTVVFNGPLAGRNVYTKDETLNEITLALQPVQTDVTALEDQQLKITNNLGTTAATYISNELDGAVLSAGPKNVKGALSALGLAHDAHTVLIDAVELLVDANSTAIAEVVAVNDTQNTRLEALETAVGVDGANIDGNTSLIQDNQNLITSLYALQGVSAGVEVFALTSNAALNGDYDALKALTDLNSGLDTNIADIATLTSDQTASGIKVQENRNGINAIREALINTCTGFTGTADELATDIAAALTALGALA